MYVYLCVSNTCVYCVRAYACACARVYDTCARVQAFFIVLFRIMMRLYCCVSDCFYFHSVNTRFLFLLIYEQAFDRGRMSVCLSRAVWIIHGISYMEQ